MPVGTNTKHGKSLLLYNLKNLLCIMHERNPFLYLYETSSKTFLSKSSSSDLILYGNMLVYFLHT